MEEKIFYQNGSVTVTQSRFIAGSVTYAIRNISSVQVGVNKASRTLQILLIILGVIIAISMIKENPILGIILAAIGGVWLYYTKDKYTVKMTTNAGQTDGHISKNAEMITKIVSALNDAIVYKG